MIKDNNLYLSPEDWESVSTYLFTERGMSRSHGSVDSIHSRFNILTRTFNTTPLNRQSFNEFIKTYQQAAHKPSYINGFIKLVKNIDKFCDLSFEDYKLQFVQRCYLKENRHSMVDTLTFEEMERIAETPVKYTRCNEGRNLKFKVLVLLLSQTGCRINEAVTLKWDDIFEDKLVFRLTKTGEDRLVPISPHLRRELLSLPHISCYLFPGEADTTKPLDRSVACLALKHRAKNAGIQKRVYNHLFRHSFITEMLRAGCELAFVSRIVGHGDFKTTARYTHFVLTDLENALYSHHSTIKEGMTFLMMQDKLEKIAKKMVDPSKYKLSILSDSGSLTINIKPLFVGN